MGGTSRLTKLWQRMDGTSRLEAGYYELPDITTNTKAYIQYAPPEIMDVNSYLVNYIKEMNGKGAGTSDTINAGVTEFTGWKSFDSEYILKLCDWIGHVIQNEYYYSEDGRGVNFLPVFSQVWGMGYKPNDVTPAHSHEPAQISWTYYPYIEDSSVAQPLELCCPPNGSIKIDLSKCAEHVQDKTQQWGDPIFTIPPVTGQLVIFPSYVFHQVKPVTVETERYCIAGNVHHDFDNQKPHWS